MYELVIPIPTAVSETVRNRVKRRMAERFGGFTATTADGGWLAPDGQVVAERVEVITAVADETAEMSASAFGRATANHVARETDESEVLWFVRDVADGGFES